jgi:hypothetical protein
MTDGTSNERRGGVCRPFVYAPCFGIRYGVPLILHFIQGNPPVNRPHLCRKQGKPKASKSRLTNDGRLLHGIVYMAMVLIYNDDGITREGLTH